MDATEAGRLEAERIHHEAVANGADPWNLLAFAISEASRRDLDVYAMPPGDPALRGGYAVFDSQSGSILYQDTGSLFDRAFLIAHELGHFVLEGGQRDSVTTEFETDCSIEDAPVGVESVLDYGARERREIRMDLFAREFLFPRSVACKLHVADNYSSAEIADRLGAPLQVVQQQLLDSLLLPAESAAAVANAAPVTTLTPDNTQTTAANHRGSPFQLQAGPGTGKTRTLVRRIETLLLDGVDPTSILVLTFSNKAANELSERIAEKNPIAAAGMWIGTFHAFGLDLIRRFHQKLGLPADPRLIDRFESIELLQDELPRLSLCYYRNLWDPTLDLNDMLNAISRAKDEVVDAAGYRALATSMRQNASNDADTRVRAEKCLEVADLFEAYEQLLAARQSIDLGDLVSLPVRLVEAHADVRRALSDRHRHVLVDEYQDVNRSSVRLLKGIVGQGKNLWVVGDARQSIYRFRGASTTNMAEFSTDFPGATVLRLGINYRSKQEIVDAFTTFSDTMKASTGALPLRLVADRGRSESAIEFKVAGSTDDEISSVAAAIEAQKKSGVSYCDQALLCASNAKLSEIAEGLEARGIPVLHLGSIFERPEIKDLLSLLSLLSDPYAVGLFRAATMPAHSIPLEEIVRVIEHLRSDKGGPLEWLHMETWPAELSESTKDALSCIAELFRGVNPKGSPWTILTTWVIDGLGIAKTLYLADDPHSKMKSLALWQFLNFCRKQPSGSGLPSTRLLDRVRRLIQISGDRGLRHFPKVADEIDAVHLMTIHASKGLEFHTVHIPGMVTSGLPRNNIPPRCLPPDGLIHGSDSLSGLEAVKAGHEEEEECLFFVALSRARDRLFLYASSRQSDDKKRNPSKFIPLISRHLVQHINPPLLSTSHQPASAVGVVWEQKPSWSDSQIAQFERCPRRFLYSHVLRLGGRRADTAFMKMHDVVRAVFDWLKVEHEMTSPSQSDVDARFEDTWVAKGAIEHGYAKEYRRIARQLVDYLMEIRSRGTPVPTIPISIDRERGEIVVMPDSVVRNDHGQITVRRVKTGKPSSRGFDDIEYTLLQLAAVQQYGISACIEVTYLTSETTEPMSLTERKLNTRIENLGRMVTNISSGNFPLNEEARVCPSCPSFFICGDLPSGPVMIKKN